MQLIPVGDEMAANGLALAFMKDAWTQFCQNEDGVGQSQAPK